MDPSLWIRRYHPAAEGAVRLLCLPHAGGSASFYHPVSQALAPDVEVLAVQYPGRQDRRQEPFVDNLPELADLLLPVLLADAGANRPLALFGHSMGASLAFELTARLEEAGAPPLMLFASGRRAPSRFAGEENIHTRGDQALLAEMKRLAGTDSRLLGDEEMLQMILPALRNDYRAAELYRPDRYHHIKTPVTALTGDTDPKAPLDAVQSWADHTSGEFRMHVYPGGHFYLVGQAAQVITEIRTTLAGFGTS
ncbi:thioesterase [Streptomyces roseirectus]|uniref:Thioesterase n=1 Tax=Streptomyces roseirectus TaxID=2768066 RepID=A0A7H0I5F9_9ACTN|nr:alpha/beta fold hydrolase [Streptomyces roseirectus]QNP68025.1 thioesterase [Streptomyces roseirectus]